MWRYKLSDFNNSNVLLTTLQSPAPTSTSSAVTSSNFNQQVSQSPEKQQGQKAPKEFFKPASNNKEKEKASDNHLELTSFKSKSPSLTHNGSEEDS